MKKIIIALGIIVILFGAGTPFINGFILEHIVLESIDNINRMYADSGQDTKLEVQKYNRGFASSTIEWRIDLGSLSSLYGVDEIIFLEKAKHGFTHVTSETSLEKNPWYNDFVQTKLAGKDPVHIHTRYSLSGDIDSEVKTDKFDLQDGKNIAQVMPATILFTMDKGLTRISSKVNWDGARIEEILSIGKVKASSKMNKISTYVWDGTFSFDVEHVSGQDEKSSIDISRLSGQSTVEYNEEKQTMSLVVGCGLDRFSENTTDHIKDAFAKLELNNIDVEAYEGIMKLYSGVMNDVVDTGTGNRRSPQEVEREMLRQMAGASTQATAEFEKMLKKDFEIRISDLKATMPQGELKADISLGLKKDMTVAGFLPVLMQPSVVLDIFSLSSDVRLPFEIVGENPALLYPQFPGMQTGLFVRDGDYLFHSAEIQDGKLLLNQKEFILH